MAPSVFGKAAPDVAESISANQVLIPPGRLLAVRCTTTGPSRSLSRIYSSTMYPSMLAVRARQLGPPEDPKNGRLSPYSAIPKRSLPLLVLLHRSPCRLLPKNQHSYIAFTWQLLPVPGRANVVCMALSILARQVSANASPPAFFLPPSARPHESCRSPFQTVRPPNCSQFRPTVRVQLRRISFA